MTSPCPVLTIVVPCYNEEDVLPETAKRLDLLLVQLIGEQFVSNKSSVCFVDDGSRDRTWAIVEDLRKNSGRVGGIKLSRNRGHQLALMTGLLSALGDIVISVDADLQDDVNAIRDMLREAASGADIVYGVRRGRDSDTWLKRTTARFYYHLLRTLGVDIIFDHADFRLMTRRALEALRDYEESNVFLRALIPLLGFPSAIVTYDRAERFAGTSKYTIGKMLALAVEGITSFSNRPLRMVTVLGLVVSFLASCLVVWAVFAAIVLQQTIPGWASTVIPIYLISGVQLLCVGIIGEYIGKIYLETKRRPRSHISQILQPNFSHGSDVAKPAQRVRPSRVNALR